MSANEYEVIVEPFDLSPLSVNVRHRDTREYLISNFSSLGQFLGEEPPKTLASTIMWRTAGFELVS